MTRTRIAGFLSVLIQLALLVLVIRQFQIENSAFLRLTLFAFAGFAVHFFLPARARLPFFVIVSLGAILAVMGLGPGALLIVLGLGLVGLCHLPVPFSARIGLLLIAGAGLAFFRSGGVWTAASSALWPILGSMFMFRLIVYMYDLEHDKAPFSLWRTLGYFFLLPNVCFPLFPVVDFKTFRRTYYNQSETEIYQVGVNWMLRGVTQLILYRVVYYYLALSASDIANARDLAQYLVTNFLLYLRVSGQFHLVIGMLHLFGFNLPTTNNRYCLSSSFTDFWRRINIYWKDFMIKVFYYPAYFRVKKAGETKAIVLSTLFVFAVTWVLHSYQWYWLRGSFPFQWQDAAFWGILAVLVVANSLYERKYGRRRRALTASRHSAGSLALVGAKTAVTFSIIISLWSLWTSQSFGGWLSMWSVPVRMSDVALIVGGALLLGALGAVSFALESPATAGRAAASFRFRPARFTALLLLAGVGLPQVYEHFAPQTASLIVSLKSGKLSRRDMAALERGYYEDLMQVNRVDGQLWQVYMNKPLEWLDIQGTGLVRFTGNFLQRELVPSRVSTDSFSTVSTNHWGMRDREYDKIPAPGVYRMSLLGASIAMGWGVEDGETYESIVEDRLNKDLGGRGYQKYEILNEAVPGYYPLQQIAVLQKALSSEPRAVLYEATGREFSRAVYYFSEVVSKRIDIPYPKLRAIGERAGVKAGMAQDEAERRLTGRRTEILKWLYRTFAETCREARVVPVWVFVPQTYAGDWQEETQPAKSLASEAGFLVIDLSDAYEGQDTTKLMLAEWDRHPNARGHQLIADRLYAALRSNQDRLGLLEDERRNKELVENGH